jgi:hypothetical protein
MTLNNKHSYIFKEAIFWNRTDGALADFDNLIYEFHNK